MLFRRISKSDEELFSAESDYTRVAVAATPLHHLLELYATWLRLDVQGNLYAL
nr:hypothetical protein [Fischerella sp. PCC 9605]